MTTPICKLCGKIVGHGTGYAVVLGDDVFCHLPCVNASEDSAPLASTRVLTPTKESPMISETERQTMSAMVKLVQDARADEREKAAKIADAYAAEMRSYFKSSQKLRVITARSDAAEAVAAMIRAGK